MDTANFIVKRAELQRRMELRRSEVLSIRESRRINLLPWALKAGFSLLTGVQGNPKTYGWMGSMAGAVVLPAILKMMGRKKEVKSGFFQRLAQAVFPSY